MSKKETIEMEFDGEKFQQVHKYSDKYSEKGLFDKITGVVKKVGIGLLYKALQLFYVAQNPKCPMKIKAAIFATLGYFISPLDVIPDITPVLGFTDDAGMIAVALVMAQMYIDDNIKQQAKDKLKSLFGEKFVTDLEI